MISQFAKQVKKDNPKLKRCEIKVVLEDGFFFLQILNGKKSVSTYDCGDTLNPWPKAKQLENTLNKLKIKAILLPDEELHEFDELMEEIKFNLQNMDGNDLADFCNELGMDVMYKGDGLWRVK